MTATAPVTATATDIPAVYLDEYGGDSRPSAYWELDGLPVDPRSALPELLLMVVRAHALGHCTWELAAFLQGHVPASFPEVILRAFGEGHVAESQILERLYGPEMKWQRVPERAQAVGELKVGPGRVVRFHPDDVAIGSDNVERLIEVKFLAHDTWDEIHHKGVDAPSFLRYGYDWQLSAMMHGTKLPALLVLGEKIRKPDGTVKIGNLALRYVDTPPRSFGDIVKKVAEIHRVATGDDLTTTDRPCDNPKQWPCLFRHLRPEPETDAAPLPEIDEEHRIEADQLMSSYLRAHEVETRGKADKKKARERLDILLGRATGTTGTHEYVVVPDPRRTIQKDTLIPAMAAKGLDLEDFFDTTDNGKVLIRPAKGKGGK